jgi:nicotinamide phosphoribosyltransferase
MWNNNIMLLTDSYKQSHARQYPEGTEYVYSYLESRGGEFEETVFFGLHYILKQYLEGYRITEADVLHASTIVDSHMGRGTFNLKGWMHIVENHGGRLPVRIEAVPEGTVVGVSNVLMTVMNTDPECFWLTNFLETLLLQVWYPITVATLSRECKKLISKSLKETTDYSSHAEFETALSFKMHDFGFRGASSVETAALGGAAHLINFAGSDTLVAIPFIHEYYKTSMMPSYSIPASEHSTITSWGKPNEVDAYRNMLEKYPTGVVACVSDSYDIQEACRTHWASLKTEILSRDGVLVIRPDSGDIKMTLQVVLSELWRVFGGEVVNGYKILNSKVRVIQGDGMNYDSLKETLEYINMIGYSTENLAFGMGGALLQKVNRDTQKFAFKCSAICVNGEWKDVFKSPTELDSNGDKHASFKKSKLGFLALERSQEGFRTVQNSAPGAESVLEVVFENGKIMSAPVWPNVINRAKL